MLTYNRPQLISRAIQSVLDQTFQQWELLVVHDGPNERTAELMQVWRQRDGRIRYLRREKVGNIAEATNFGLSQARGDYIAILDDDDCWTAPDKLEKQVRFLDERPEYVGCGGGVIVVDRNGNETLRYLKPPEDEQIKRRALFANPMAHSTTVYRRAAIEAQGLYDVTLAGFQDWDVWLKLGQAGKLYNFPEFFVYYTLWEAGGSFRQQRNNTRSALRIVWRHRGAYGGFWLALPLTLLYYAYAHLPSIVHKFSFAFLSRLKKAAFSGRPPH